MKYDCTELVGNVCVKWQPATNTGILDSFAITKEQANEIAISMLVVWFGAWAIRQVLNLLLKRRY